MTHCEVIARELLNSKLAWKKEQDVERMRG